MRIRASLWVSLAAVVLISPAVMVARLVETDLYALVANRVTLPKNPPLPQPRHDAPMPLQPRPRGEPQPPPSANFEPLGMVRSKPDELGQVPDHFFWLRQNLLAVQDPLDGQLVFLNDGGQITGRGILPPDFHIGEVAAGANVVRLIDTTGRRQMSIARNIDPGATRSLQALPITPDGTTRAALVTRRSAETLQLRDESDARAKPIDVRSVTGAPLAQAYEIAPEPNHVRYVVSEEIVTTSPVIRVKVFVRRYATSGEITGIVYVPLDGFEVVPHDFIGVGADGVVRVMAPTPTGVVLRRYEFTPPPRDGRRLGEQELKSLGRSLPEANVRTRIPDVVETEFRNKLAPTVKFDAPTPTISRANVIAGARAYLTVDWTMQRENFEKPGVDNVCQPRAGKYWERPRHFTEANIGTTIGPMPYRWGGDDTPSTYNLRIEWGALAGSICTCRQADLNFCLVPQAAGVDCSGFVSRAWGIDKRGTVGLLDVADEVKSIADLKPGDAFDWPERHVRLFIGMAPGAVTAFKTLEASTRLECEGVCEATYRPSELEGYRIIRYRGITDQVAAATPPAPESTPTPAGTAPPPPANGATAPTTVAPDVATNGAKPTANGTASPANGVKRKPKAPPRKHPRKVWRQ